VLEVNSYNSLKIEIPSRDPSNDKDETNNTVFQSQTPKLQLRILKVWYLNFIPLIGLV